MQNRWLDLLRKTSQISSHRFPHIFLGSRDGAVVIVLASHFCGLGSIPEPDVTCELSLSLVLVFAPTAFLQVLRFYFLFRNQHFKFQFNLSETEKDKSHLVKCPLLNSHFYFVSFLFMSSIVGLRIFKINRLNTSTRDFGKQ